MGKEFQPIKTKLDKRNVYDKAFKLSAVKRLQTGNKPASQLAAELGIRRNQLYKWANTLAQNGGDESLTFNGSGNNKLGKFKAPHITEIKRLKRELALVQEEMEILKKAQAYFAKARK